MTETDYSRKLDELDRLLNDPDVRLEPARVWALLAEVSRVEPAGARPAPIEARHPLQHLV